MRWLARQLFCWVLAVVFLGSTVNPFAVGAAVSSLVDAGIQVNQGIIIALGAILWISTTAVSIIYVMKYAAKVKKDRGSTILSLQEQEAEKENFGKDNALPKTSSLPVVRRVP